jgi:hypothetical protein
MKTTEKSGIFSLFFKREKAEPLEKADPITIVREEKDEDSELDRINPDDFYDLDEACEEFDKFWLSFHSDRGDDPEDARPLIEELHRLTGRMLGK